MRAVLVALVTVLSLAGCAGGATAVLDGPVTAGASSAAGKLAAASSDQGSTCPAPSPTAPGAAESRLPVKSLCALPAEAAIVWRVISTGGRPAYPKDGTVFGNFERRLPQRQRGYYREYTVPTPGLSHRGARRLVSGQGKELYYTADHYGSFVVVDPTAVAR